MIDFFRQAYQSHNFDLYSLFAYVLGMLIIIFVAIPIHEFSHAFVAAKLGDSTPKYQRRLTANPLAHIDPIGALCLILFGFGWGKSVQIDNRNFKYPKFGMALVAAAGPLSNIILAFISYVIVKVVPLSGLFGSFLAAFLINLIRINVFLAVFNIIPIPPLDGSKILAVFIPDRLYYRYLELERYFIFAIFALLFFGVLDLPIAFIQSLVYKVFARLTFFL